MKKNKRVRISNESVNCYGTRILTSGLDLSQYQRNPVLLYMHERGTVVGLVRDIKVEGQDVTGELVFDGATELSRQLQSQWEFGSLKMVSANIQILETSDDKALLLDGQTRPTITRSKLFEVSVVDIGGNDDALVLSSASGETLSLSAQDAAHLGEVLPLVGGREKEEEKDQPLNNSIDMELKQIALRLGLNENATEAEVNAKADELLKAQRDVEQMKLAAIGETVDNAIREKRVAATMREHFVKLGRQVGLDELKTTLAAMQPQMKLSQQLNRRDAPAAPGDGDFAHYEKLSAVPADLMWDLHDNHHDDFVRLYKAEYGEEPEQ